MSMSGKSSSRTNAISRINLRWPWLKLALVLFIGLMAILDLLDLTIPKVSENYRKISIAPMSKHVRATERVFKDRKLVALTFDDGPSPETTPGLLDILYTKDVPATFFMLGSKARNYPDIVTRASKEGNEVASHTMYHQNLIRIPASSAQSDINEAKSAIQDILGKSPHLTRPPYGNYNDDIRNFAGTPLILWSVDTLDWQSRNPDAILETAMNQVHDGAIILMHDIYPATVEAVPRLIDTLRQNGYEFVTVPELAEMRGISLQNSTAYYNFRP